MIFLLLSHPPDKLLAGWLPHSEQIECLLRPFEQRLPLDDSLFVWFDIPRCQQSGNDIRLQMVLEEFILGILSVTHTHT